MWDQVQSRLAENRVERDGRSAEPSAPSLLTGLVYDGVGERMSPTHANKKGTPLPLLRSQSLIKQARSKTPATARRVPASDLETIVENRIRALLQDRAAIYDLARTAQTGRRRREGLAGSCG